MRDKKLIRAINEYIAAVQSEDGYVDSDIKHYIFEAAVEWLHGEDIWDRLEEAPLC